ncbi:MAG: tetratricopeptide repeat protein [Deltaproteobacteria bacterium]|nr:tetratricopeptide repeat protein [Deltaproteobacteria bacterium]
MPTRSSDDNGRSQKLKSYDSKDYSENIEFPVELVDRDGVVRRYSYEESLAVYHRRIQSAPWRYSDELLIRAEIGHCTRRIDQIKRSHQERAASGVHPPSLNPRASLGQGYDLLRRFYRSALRDRGLAVDGELPMKLALLEDRPDCRTYHVGFGSGRSEHLLYVYPFDRASDSDPRTAYQTARSRYRGQVPGAGIERLLLEEETPEAGYLLTGASEVVHALSALARELHSGGGSTTGPADHATESPLDWIGADLGARSDDDDAPRTSFDLGVAALRAERTDEAVDHLRNAVQENPWHREGYLALLAVLDGAGLHDEAEMYGTMAAHYLADDGLVKYRRGINMVRQGRMAEAVESFDEAGVLDDSLYQSSYFAAHVLLARGADLDGAIHRMKTAVKTAPPELGLDRLLRSLKNARILRWVLRSAGLSAALMSVILVSRGYAWGWFVGLAGVAMFTGARALTAALARLLVQRRVMDPTSSPSSD